MRAAGVNRLGVLIRSNTGTFSNSSILVSGPDHFSAISDHLWDEVSFAVLENKVPIAACLA